MTISLATHIPLLISKIRVPAMPQVAVSRARLLATWESERAKVILINAAAGAGKTTLALQLATSWGVPVAWFSLGVGENRAGLFARYLVTSLVQVFPAVEPLLALIDDEQMENLEPLLSALLARLMDAPPLVVVLDDVHVIESPVVREGLRFWVHHVPPHIKLILTSRTVPDIGVAALRTKGVLRTLTADDLNFTEDEAHRFFLTHLPFAPTVQQSAAASIQAEGWVAGLNILALAAAQRGALLAPTDEGFDSRQHLWDFFAEEIFDRQSESLRTFLFATSVLDQFDVSLAAEVAETTDAASLLTQLLRANLFVVALDNNETWFRYHHLFVDFLRHRVARLQPEMVALLHQRACEAWLRRGEILEACRHAQFGGDVNQLARVLQTHAWTLFYRAKRLMTECLTELPREVVAASLSLTQIQAWLYMEAGEWVRVEPLLQLAKTLRQGADDTNDALAEGCWACVRAQLAEMREDVQTIRSQLEIASRCLPQGDPGQLTVALLSASLALRDGRVDHAEAMYREAITLARLIQNHSALMWSYSRLGGIVYLRGDVREGCAIWTEAVSEAIRLGILGEHNLLYIYIGLVDAHRELYDWTSAETHLRNAQQLAEQLGARWLVPVCVMRVRCALTFPTQLAAEASLSVVEKLCQEADTNSYDVAQMSEVSMGWWLAGGDVAAIRQWLKRVSCEPHLSGDPSSLIYLRAWARAQLAVGSPAAAIAGLRQAIEVTRRCGYPVKLMRNLIILSAGLAQLGDAEAAASALAEALALGVRMGTLGSFVAMRPEMEVCLALKLDSLTVAEKRFMQRVRDLVHQRPRRLSLSEQMLPAIILAIPLTVREWETLQLIGDALSNEQIAERLFVDVSTVKSHIKSAYRKLGVKTRAQAAHRVHELLSKIKSGV